LIQSNFNYICLAWYSGLLCDLFNYFLNDVTENVYSKQQYGANSYTIDVVCCIHTI